MRAVTCDKCGADITMVSRWEMGAFAYKFLGVGTQGERKGQQQWENTEHISFDLCTDCFHVVGDSLKKKAG